MRPFALLWLISSLLLPLEVQADQRIYCPLPEQGVWINKSAQPKELARLEIETKCINDQVQARIRAFTKCAPRDCKWGWTTASLRDGGGLNVLLVGFLGSKNIDVRGFGDRLDAFVTDIKHDPRFPDEVKSYSLTRE